MKYQGTDKNVRVGDKVRYAGMEGEVVFIVNDDSYLERYAKEHWSYLGKGFGVELQVGEWRGTLFHLNSSEEEEDLEPVE
jgi:hypothetical protein